MTARPRMLKMTIDVPLARPRRPEMVTSPTFLELRRTLIASIREESLKAMGGELVDGALEGLGLDVGPEGVARLI